MCKYFVFCVYHGFEQILTKTKQNIKLYVMSSLIISPTRTIQEKTTHQYKQDCESHTLLRWFTVQLWIVETEIQNF